MGNRQSKNASAVSSQDKPSDEWSESDEKVWVDLQREWHAGLRSSAVFTNALSHKLQNKDDFFTTMVRSKQDGTLSDQERRAIKLFWTHVPTRWIQCVFDTDMCVDMRLLATHTASIMNGCCHYLFPVDANLESTSPCGIVNFYRSCDILEQKPRKRLYHLCSGSIKHLFRSFQDEHPYHFEKVNKKECQKFFVNEFLRFWIEGGFVTFEESVNLHEAMDMDIARRIDFSIVDEQQNIMAINLWRLFSINITLFATKATEFNNKFSESCEGRGELIKRMLLNPLAGNLTLHVDLKFLGQYLSFVRRALVRSASGMDPVEGKMPVKRRKLDVRQ